MAFLCSHLNTHSAACKHLGNIHSHLEWKQINVECCPHRNEEDLIE